MKTLFIYYKYPFFIDGSYFQEFILKYSETINQAYLLATHYPKGKLDNNKNLRYFWLPLLNVEILGELFFMITALFKAIFDRDLHKVDVVNSIGPRGLLAGWYLRKKHKIPLICTIEILNERGGFKNNLNYWLVKLLIRKAPVDKFICWSNYYRINHLLKWGIAEKKITLITIGIDMGTYSQRVNGKDIKTRYAANNPLIVFAKPLYPANAEAAKLLIKAVAILRDTITIKLLIGSGPMEESVKKLIENLNITEQVSFMPPTPFPEIPRYIAAADLIVLPFTYAPTTSRSLLEAMAMGKPIISVSTGEVGQILTNENNALLVEPSPESLATAIKRIIGDKQLADRLSENARDLAKQKFDLNQIVNETIHIFNDVCQRKHA